MQKRTFLLATRKMMRSFGDSAYPSRFSAFIVVRHINLFLRALVEAIYRAHFNSNGDNEESSQDSTDSKNDNNDNNNGNNNNNENKNDNNNKNGNGHNKTSKTAKCKPKKFVLSVKYLAPLYPKHFAIFNRCKYMRSSVQKAESDVAAHRVNKEFNDGEQDDDGQFPDITTDANDNKYDFEEVLTLQIKYNNNNNNNNKYMYQSDYITELREASLESPELKCIITLSKPKISIGWSVRIQESDLFTKFMDKNRYFRYSRCREGCYPKGRKLAAWLKLLERRDISLEKGARMFLSFLAWDRLGCIIQIARGVRGLKHGTIIEDKYKYLNPTEI
ncbi:FNIP repeat-containing protein, partial [Reticulomyxa filosa]